MANTDLYRSIQWFSDTFFEPACCCNKAPELVLMNHSFNCYFASLPLKWWDQSGHYCVFEYPFFFRLILHRIFRVRSKSISYQISEVRHPCCLLDIPNPDWDEYFGHCDWNDGIKIAARANITLPSPQRVRAGESLRASRPCRKNVPDAVCIPTLTVTPHFSCERCK